MAWCCGTAAEAFDYEVQFGHAGARARDVEETAGAKNRAMAKAGTGEVNACDRLHVVASILMETG